MQTVVLALALMAAPALAQESGHTEGSSGDTKAASESAEQPKKICRKIEDGMNSRRKVNVCMSADEWRKFNQGN